MKKPRGTSSQVRIRAFWAAVLPILGFAIEALIGYLANIDLLREWFTAPVAIAFGATLYGVKRYYWPDTKW